MSTERRLHVGALPPEGGTIRLDEAASHHARVLRLAPGDELTLFDGRGGRAAARILAIDEGIVVSAAPRVEGALGSGVTLVLCLPRGGKLDDLVRAATELGVDAIRLATSERTVSRSDERWERKHERLLRVVKEAARQSERDALPTIEAPAPLLEAARAPAEARKLAFCGRTGRALPTRTDAPTWVVIGPEGGLAEGELEDLAALGYQAVSLGPTILRVETAVVAALAVALQGTHADPDR